MGFPEWPYRGRVVSNNVYSQLEEAVQQACRDYNHPQSVNTVDDAIGTILEILWENGLIRQDCACYAAKD